MKYQTILICSIFVCLMMFSCKSSNLYYIHHTKFGRFDYRIPCNPELVDKVNTNWLKHGRFDCHYYNEFVQNFTTNYRYCVVGLDKELIRQLLGKPNNDADSKFVYILAERCDRDMKIFRRLIFIYDAEGKITNLTLEWITNNH